MEEVTYFRAAEAARYLKIAIPTFRKYIREGILPKPRKLGRSSIWRRDELDAALEAAQADLPERRTPGRPKALEEVRHG